MSEDWTALNGVSNSSTVYVRLTELLTHIIRNSGYDLMHGRSDTVACVIVAHLAHEYGMQPTDRTYETLNIIRLE